MSIGIKSLAPTNFLSNIKKIELPSFGNIPDNPVSNPGFGGMLNKAWSGITDFKNQEGGFGPFKPMKMGDRFKTLGQGFSNIASNIPKYNYGKWQDYADGNRWNG